MADDSLPLLQRVTCRLHPLLIHSRQRQHLHSTVTTSSTKSRQEEHCHHFSQSYRSLPKISNYPGLQVKVKRLKHRWRKKRNYRLVDPRGSRGRIRMLVNWMKAYWGRARKIWMTTSYRLLILRPYLRRKCELDHRQIHQPIDTAIPYHQPGTTLLSENRLRTSTTQMARENERDMEIRHSEQRTSLCKIRIYPLQVVRVDQVQLRERVEPNHFDRLLVIIKVMDVLDRNWVQPR